MKHILITGANRGIGLELCRQFLQRDAQVTAVCREASAALEKLDARVIAGIDVTRDTSVEKLAAALADQRIDCLVNNAGILQRDTLENLDFEDIERQFQVNALGPLRVTHAVLPHLVRDSRVIIITSRMGSIGDNTSGGYYGYRMSKAAVNMAGVSLARDLREKGIAVGILHPGMVATDMTGGNGVPVSDAAKGLIARIEGLDVNNSGSFWHAEGYELPW